MLKMKKKVSFDFDSTLDKPNVQEYAKSLIDSGIEVWVVTTRNHRFCDEVKEVTDKLGIPSWRVIFTSGNDKWKFFREWKEDPFLWHLDDDSYDLIRINSNCQPTKGLSVWGNDNWKFKADKIIEKNK